MFGKYIEGDLVMHNFALFDVVGSSVNDSGLACMRIQGTAREKRYWEI